MVELFIMEIGRRYKSGLGHLWGEMTGLPGLNILPPSSGLLEGLAELSALCPPNNSLFLNLFE